MHHESFGAPSPKSQTQEQRCACLPSPLQSPLTLTPLHSTDQSPHSRSAPFPPSSIHPPPSAINRRSQDGRAKKKNPTINRHCPASNPNPAPAMRHPGVLLLLLATIPLLVAPLAAAWRPWPPRSSTAPGTSALGASKKFEGSSEFVKLRYHMGPVLSSTITVHPIWYGAWPAAQKRTIRAFLRSLSPTPAEAARIPAPTVSAWWRTVRLYTDQTAANVSAAVSLGREKSDARMSRGARLSRLDIQAVVRDAVAARTRPLPADSGAAYLVLTSADVAVEDFCGQVCGFHYFTFPSVVGYTLPYAWVGNSARRCPEVCAYPFAAPAYAPPSRRPQAPPNGDVGVDGMVSVIAHELAELASNPLANAWYAGSDPSFPTEIADLCEGIYGTGGGGAYTGQLLTDARSGASYNVNGAGGRKFLVQWVWNPVLSYCSGPNALDHQ